MLPRQVTLAVENPNQNLVPIIEPSAEWPSVHYRMPARDLPPVNLPKPAASNPDAFPMTQYQCVNCRQSFAVARKLSHLNAQCKNCYVYRPKDTSAQRVETRQLPPPQMVQVSGFGNDDSLPCFMDLPAPLSQEEIRRPTPQPVSRQLPPPGNVRQTEGVQRRPLKEVVPVSSPQIDDNFDKMMQKMLDLQKTVTQLEKANLEKDALIKKKDAEIYRLRHELSEAKKKDTWNNKTVNSTDTHLQTNQTGWGM